MVVEVVMKFEFNQGVPQECIDWLWENVGQGNVQPKMVGPLRTFPTCDNDAWYYERMVYEVHSDDPRHESGARYVPTIFIEDEKKAILFALRWS